MTLTLLAALVALVVTVALLVRFNFIVIDGHVLWWQVSPIASRGRVENGREYRAVLYYVEQIFQSGGFDRPVERKLADNLNAMLTDYHSRMDRPKSATSK